MVHIHSMLHQLITYNKLRLKIIWGLSLHSLQSAAALHCISGNIRKSGIVEDEAVSYDNSIYYYRKCQV